VTQAGLVVPGTRTPAGRRPRPLADARVGPLLRLLLRLSIVLLVVCGAPALAGATDLKVSDVVLEPCPADDLGTQPTLARPSGATCWALRGVVVNNGSKPVVDTDVFGLILDASGEPVLPNRTRVGSIGDVPPGRSSFALRLAVPAGTPGPLGTRSVKARGFSAPVRTRAGVDDELLPLEEALAASPAGEPQ
jgi:hypothetical protein